MEKLYIRPAIESESVIIGALLIDHKLFNNIKDILCHSDFLSIKNGKIFQAIRFLHDKYGYFDIPIIIDYMQYEDSMDIAHLYELAEHCCSTANIEAHAAIVREKSVQAQLSQCAHEIKAFAKLKMNHKELLANFMEEAAAEIKITEMTHEYLSSLLLEVSKAFTSASLSLETLDDEEQ